MASIDVPSAGAALTGTGTTLGVVAVADTTAFYAGMIGWISDGTKNVRVLVTKIVDATHLALKAIGSDSGSNVTLLNFAQGSDMSGFTTGARVDMPGQLVRVDWANAKRSTAY